MSSHKPIIPLEKLYKNKHGITRIPSPKEVKTYANSQTTQVLTELFEELRKYAITTLDTENKNQAQIMVGRFVSLEKVLEVFKSKVKELNNGR